MWNKSSYTMLFFFRLVRELVASFSMRRVFFNPWSVRLGLEMDSVALAEVLIRVFLFYLFIIIHPKLPIHFIHTSLLPVGQRGETYIFRKSLSTGYVNVRISFFFHFFIFKNLDSLKEHVTLWTGLICIRTWFSVGIIWTTYELSGCTQYRKFFIIWNYFRLSIRTLLHGVS